MFYLFLLLALPFGALGGEMTHQFVNPDFGGSPLNGSYLISNAQAQNDYKAKAPVTASSNKAKTPESNTAEQFAQSVNQMLQAALASRLVNNILGTDGSIKPGTVINTGVNTIQIDQTDMGTTVKVTDNKTGAVSIINLPKL